MSFAEFVRSSTPLPHIGFPKRPGVFKVGDHVYYLPTHSSEPVHGVVEKLETHTFGNTMVWCYWDRNGRPQRLLMGWMPAEKVHHA